MTTLDTLLKTLKDLVENAGREKITADDLRVGFCNTMDQINGLTGWPTKFQNANEKLTQAVVEYERSPSLGIKSVSRELELYCEAAHG
ncbi:hypothetical protein [Bradyrhizobium oligotrophicum]|uniref:hypothetical protein n=1 Tax=Bradyrhizobium oligotrophicum TaxID=44255 RepID=UPI003EB928DA